MNAVVDRGMGHSEESRLANLLRRVSREDDRDRRLATLRQLKDFISHSESKVVSFFELLFILHIFHPNIFTFTCHNANGVNGNNLKDL